jgi:hypothetical protein
MTHASRGPASWQPTHWSSVRRSFRCYRDRRSCLDALAPAMSGPAAHRVLLIVRLSSERARQVVRQDCSLSVRGVSLLRSWCRQLALQVAPARPQGAVSRSSRRRLAHRASKPPSSSTRLPRSSASSRARGEQGEAASVIAVLTAKPAGMSACAATTPTSIGPSPKPRSMNTLAVPDAAPRSAGGTAWKIAANTAGVMNATPTASTTAATTMTTAPVASASSRGRRRRAPARPS